MADMACENCGREDSKKPAIFRGERWCSDLCRKALVEKGSDDDH